MRVTGTADRTKDSGISSAIDEAVRRLTDGGESVFLVARLEPFLREPSPDPRKALPSKVLLTTLRKIASALPSAVVDARDPREMLRLTAIPGTDRKSVV